MLSISFGIVIKTVWKGILCILFFISVVLLKQYQSGQRINITQGLIIQAEVLLHLLNNNQLYFPCIIWITCSELLHLKILFIESAA